MTTIESPQVLPQQQAMSIALIVEATNTLAARPPHAVLDVPASGRASLYLDAAGEPGLAESIPAGAAWAASLECVRTARRPPRLLMRAGRAGGAPCVIANGVMAPRLVVLGTESQVLLASRWLLYVTLFTRPQVGPPPPEKVGKDCPICLRALTVEAVCYHCPCGTLIHHEAVAAGDEEIQCARAISACPDCEQPIVEQAGYAWWPEGVAHA